MEQTILEISLSTKLKYTLIYHDQDNHLFPLTYQQIKGSIFLALNKSIIESRRVYTLQTKLKTFIKF